MHYLRFPHKPVPLLLLLLLLGGCRQEAEAPLPAPQVEISSEEIFQQQLNAAQNGDIDAQLHITLAYLEGEGTEKDISTAMQWAEKAAAGGNLESQYLLGWHLLYSTDEDVSKDSSRGIRLIKEAADKGHAGAKRILALEYIEGNELERDPAKAESLLQQAADQGDSLSMAALSDLYQAGIDGIDADQGKSFEWLEKAATKGYGEAQRRLGEALLHGNGTAKDAGKAIEWLAKAAVQDDEKAQYVIGNAYFNGVGVAQDEAKGVEWWKRSAEKGFMESQVNLGWAYRNGRGVPQDNILAYAWSNLAAADGLQLAIYNRDTYATLLTGPELAEAQRLSSFWEKGKALSRESSPDSRMSSENGQTPLALDSTGTLFVISKSKAVTNYHVVQGCVELRIEGWEGVASVVTEDKVNDLALIQLPRDVPASARIAPDMQSLRQGDDVMVFGFPLRQMLSSGGNLTPGIISALSGLGNNTNQIQITAPIQPGSSGSPVLNSKGEVVGVVSMKLDDVKMTALTGGIGQNVNFAVNGQTLTTFLDTHDVPYSKGGFFSWKKSSADVAKRAREWTFPVQCWR